MLTDPNEIVDRMMQQIHVPGGPCHCGYKSDKPPMPEHRAIVCKVVEVLVKRAWCAETFKTWGTPKEIAANMFKLKPALSEQSLGALSKLFPSPPVDQSRLSSDVLE